jgi:hypothetical protein
MKKLLLFIAILCFCSTSVFALKVINNTKCDIDVTIQCYDLCVLVGTQTQTVPALQSRSFTNCIVGDFAIAHVCWSSHTPCQWPPIKQCVTIDASSPAAPAPCSPGTYSGQIIFCNDCTQNGVANVVYNPTTDEIRVQ